MIAPAARRATTVATALVLLGCAELAAPDAVGVWGGTEASLVLTRAGGTVSYACGAGVIDAGWSVAPDGRFAATGVHYSGGGPVPPTGRPPHPARYAGRLDGNALTFTVTLTDSAQVLGPFHLVRNGPAVQEICV